MELFQVPRRAQVLFRPEAAVMGNNKREFPFKQTLRLSIASVYFSIFGIFFTSERPTVPRGNVP